MPKKIYLIPFLIVLLSLGGCSQSQQEDQKEDKAEILTEFTDKKWLFYDEVTAEHLCLYLGSDGSYSYHCQCGEPVGDSDLYDEYEYDEGTNSITLFNSYDDETDQIEVIEYNEHHLMIIIDDELKDFVLGEMDTASNFWSLEGEKYLAGYNSRCTIVDYENGKVVCGPVEYDKEGINEDGPFEEYEIVDDVKVSELSIKSFNSIQDDQEYEEYYDVKYFEIGSEELENIIENGALSALLWFDDNLKVEKIVFYGQLSVTADYIVITVPAEETGNITQEELDQMVEEGLCDAAKLEEDGSVFYLMDQEQYKIMQKNRM